MILGSSLNEEWANSRLIDAAQLPQTCCAAASHRRTSSEREFSAVRRGKYQIAELLARATAQCGEAGKRRQHSRAIKRGLRGFSRINGVGAESHWPHPRPSAKSAVTAFVSASTKKNSPHMTDPPTPRFLFVW